MTQDASPGSEAQPDRTVTPFFTAHDLPIGIQLFPLSAELAADIDGTLARLVEIGFRTVETAGLIDRSAVDLRSALDRAGLVCTSMHVPGETLLRPTINLREHLDQVVDHALRLGARDIVMPIFLMPERVGPLPTVDPIPFIHAAGASLNQDDFARIADFLNLKGEALGRHGLRLGYHNHGFELLPKGDRHGLDLLIAGTDPAFVTFELDIGWAAAAGIDPAALFAAYPGRFSQVHVKDGIPTVNDRGMPALTSTLLGAGAIDLPHVLAAAYAAGVRGYYVEQEPPFDEPRLDAMAKNHAFIEKVVAS